MTLFYIIKNPITGKFRCRFCGEKGESHTTNNVLHLNDCPYINTLREEEKKILSKVFMSNKEILAILERVKRESEYIYDYKNDDYLIPFKKLKNCFGGD